MCRFFDGVDCAPAYWFSRLLGSGSSSDCSGRNGDGNNVVGQGRRVLEENDRKQQVNRQVDAVVVENRVVD